MDDAGDTERLAKLIARAKRLGREYYDLTARPLGVTSEIGEYEAARLLGLTLAQARQPGWDATGETTDGLRRYQIKSRCLLPTSKRGQRVGSISLAKEWDAVLLVLLDQDFEATAIHEADRAVVMQALMRPGSRARNERGALSVSQFIAVATPVWPVAPQQRVVSAEPQPAPRR